jgi:hypothetical protein
LKTKIATILRKTRRTECVEKAEILENTSAEINSLHFRNLGLNSAEILEIANVLADEKLKNSNLIRSVSFSYNKEFGDFGAEILSKSLPKSVVEIGLVGCGISDIGGTEILDCIREMPNLSMICIEQNHFSNQLKMKFLAFRAANLPILVIV